MWTKLLKMRRTLTSAMIILLSVATMEKSHGQTQEELLIQLIKQNAKDEGVELTEDEIKKWVERLLNPPADPPLFNPCWARTVKSYNPGNPSPHDKLADPQQILGEANADSIDLTKSVSLGNTQDENGPYGEIIVSFGKQFTVRPAKNLYLYEVGTDTESVYLQVHQADTGIYHPADPGLLVTPNSLSETFTTIELSQFGISNEVKLDAVRIRDAVDGEIGSAAAGADIDAIGIDCLALPVKIRSIEANHIEEGIVILWKTGLMKRAVKFDLMRIPLLSNGQLDTKDQATFISQKNYYYTGVYGALESLPPPGRYAYVIKEITDGGESIWHDAQGDRAIIEIQ